MTARQRAFVEAYAGNATEAAIVAGYSRRTAYSQGQRMLKNVEVSMAIQEREKVRSTDRISTREERLILLTRIARDENEPTMARLRAIELMCRAEGDFLERVEHTVDAGLNLQAQIHAVILRQAKEEHRREEEARKIA